MASPGAYVNHKHYNWVVPTATLYTSYTLNKHWLVSVDGTYILGRKTLHNWGNSDIPNTDASANIFASAGVSYRNAWMDWASKVSYMRMTNQVTNLASLRTLMATLLPHSLPFSLINSRSLGLTMPTSILGADSTSMCASSSISPRIPA